MSKQRWVDSLEKVPISEEYDALGCAASRIGLALATSDIYPDEEYLLAGAGWLVREKRIGLDEIYNGYSKKAVVGIAGETDSRELLWFALSELSFAVRTSNIVSKIDSLRYVEAALREYWKLTRES